MSALPADRAVTSTADTTALLLAGRSGDRDAFDRLFVQVYDELRRIAHARLREARPETLSTTGLVHELYLRLVDQSRVSWSDRAHFLALASRAMRCILVDHARASSAEKRGGGRAPVTLTDSASVGTEAGADLLALDEALEKLTSRSERLGKLVEYRFFGGLSYEEIAEVTSLSVPTVKRDWSRARTWLHRWMLEEVQ